MAFRAGTGKFCPKCQAEMKMWAHESGPTRIGDPRNWYYECPSCSTRLEKWAEDMKGGD